MVYITPFCFLSLQLTVTAVRGPSYKGDIAIDDLKVRQICLAKCSGKTMYLYEYENVCLCVCLCVYSRFSRPFRNRLGNTLTQSFILLSKVF